MNKNDYTFSQFIKNIPSFVILNILWVICSIPVFTIGASTCAAYYVTLKILNKDDDVSLNNTARLFFKAFKDNFKQGTIMWLITIPCIAACFFVWHIILKNDYENIFIKIGAGALTVIAVTINLYTYPLLARYDNTIKKSIMNSIVICMLYFVRSLITVAVVCVEVAVAIALFHWNKLTTPFGFLVGPELMIFTVSILAKKVLQDSEKNGGTIVPPAVQIQQEIEKEKTAEAAEEVEEEVEEESENTEDA